MNSKHKRTLAERRDLQAHHVQGVQHPHWEGNFNFAIQQANPRDSRPVHVDTKRLPLPPPDRDGGEAPAARRQVWQQRRSHNGLTPRPNNKIRY